MTYEMWLKQHKNISMHKGNNLVAPTISSANFAAFSRQEMFIWHAPLESVVVNEPEWFAINSSN